MGLTRIFLENARHALASGRVLWQAMLQLALGPVIAVFPGSPAPLRLGNLWRPPSMASTLYLLVVGNTEVVSSVLEIGTLMHLSSSFMVVEATYIQCGVGGASYPRASLNARKADNSNSDMDTSTAQQYTEFTVLNSPIWRQGPDWLLIMPHLFISEHRTSYECGVASHPIDSLKITKRGTSLGNFSYAVLVHRYSLPEDTSVRAMWSSPSNLLTPENCFEKEPTVHNLSTPETPPPCPSSQGHPLKLETVYHWSGTELDRHAHFGPGLPVLLPLDQDHSMVAPPEDDGALKD
eukprot:TRINITY_DN35488_c0_g1_i1.p1 TRINITY_DN35488_c0_g1~~TRINITY_DN35488_c0_g1_i1.p1  ORF type:complete len:334 (-),score=81.33 TRINITY_DN35488_c0_g1_i1:175-1053(-)